MSIPRNIQHLHLPDDRKAPTDLTKLNPLFMVHLQWYITIHILKYSIGYARTSPYCNDHVPTRFYGKITLNELSNFEGVRSSLTEYVSTF